MRSINLLHLSSVAGFRQFCQLCRINVSFCLCFVQTAELSLCVKDAFVCGYKSVAQMTCMKDKEIYAIMLMCNYKSN